MIVVYDDDGCFVLVVVAVVVLAERGVDVEVVDNKDDADLIRLIYC